MIEETRDTIAYRRRRKPFLLRRVQHEQSEEVSYPVRTGQWLSQMYDVPKGPQNLGYRAL